MYEKDIFKIPEVKIKKETARVMGLSNSEKKMSKSDAGENNAINLLDTPDVISKKIMAAATDSENKILFDINRPAIYNLLVIYESFSGLTKGEIESKFVDGKYADFKKDLAELVAEKLKPIREKYKEISESGEIEKVLKQGADKARPMAEAKLKEVKEVIGLG